MPISTRTSAVPCVSTAITATATCSARTRPPISIGRRFNLLRPFTYGNTPRTLAHDLRNPSSFNQDFSIRRDFRIARAKLGFGVDVFNLFNNVVFGGIQTNITNANFGRVSSQTNTPRVGQIKVRLEF